MKHILFLAFLFFAITEAVAYDFKYGDLYYNVVNDSISPYEVEVTHPDNSDYEQAYIKIPSSVLYKGEKFYVTSIGGGAFCFDEHIEQIDIPNSVRTIGFSAFASCSSLKVLNIGDGIKSIDWNFFGCPNLQITIGAKNPPELTLYYKVDGCNTLYVPKESMYKYANTKGWERFERIIPIGGSISECIYHPNHDPKNMVESVAGCEFGIERNNTINFFNNKYGCYREKDSHTATYMDVNFAGQILDFMILYFKYSDKSNRDEFCAIEFQKVFKLNEYDRAKRYYEYFKGIYSDKYTNGRESNDEEHSYWCGMINREYDGSLPPINISLRKSTSRNGDEYYYLTIEYYSLNMENLYNDDI